MAKTLIARSFAAATGLRFGRVQFTPDLLPSDITGSSVFDQRAASFEFRPGPGVHQPAAGRRDQPRAAEDAGRAAGGDGGAPGHRRRRHPPARARPSSCSPRRTRSSTRAPTRCPRPSSTASSCACASATPSADDEWRMLDARARRGTDAVALQRDHRPRRAAAPAGRRRGRPRRRRGRALHGRPRDGHARELGGRGRRQPARLAGAAAPGPRAGRAGGARLRRARRRQGRRRARRWRTGSCCARSCGCARVDAADVVRAGASTTCPAPARDGAAGR